MCNMLRINSLLSTIALFLCVFSSSSVTASVTYDDKAFIIDGRRRILISGSIHYPRSTPEFILGILWVKREKRAYAKWAAEMAVGLGTGVPWTMCKQEDAPDPIIDTCNGFYCEGFKPHKDYNPKMWTEAWTGWYTWFGGPAPNRPVEDLAFSVARFIQTNGSFVNYYMYHGGTNFGRTAAGHFIATSYDYDAPIDEYACAAFLANYDTESSATVTFQNKQYDLPPWSISILPDCKTAVFNTARINSQSSKMIMEPLSTGAFDWQSYSEETVSADDSDKLTTDGLWEEINVTRDASDYLWYLTNVNIQPDEGFLSNGQYPVLTVMSAGHGLQVFINGQLSGTVYGGLENPKLTFSDNVKLRAGINKISLLSVAVGLPSGGLHFETWNAGVLGPVTLKGLNEGTRDLTNQKWSYKIGLEGEALSLHTISGSSSVEWVEGPSLAQKQPMTWYKTTFNAPEGNDPLALDMNGMGKGLIWINGESIGRHWPGYIAKGHCNGCSYAGTFNENKCQTNCGEPSQRWYHIPRSWLKPKGNLLVVFEEWGGDPTAITLVRRRTERVCADIYEGQPSLKNWRMVASGTQDNLQSKAHLWCPQGQRISDFKFASYGLPQGTCGSFREGSCHAHRVLSNFGNNLVQLVVPNFRRNPSTHKKFSLRWLRTS
ncbi:hypothetical protein RHSIM_Rhsim03G0232500 [Rhododendron simsii]|uniref:beta-galactosidase n=1 Tax=Rhododendron simsii TaxID=118357 RepID=A0A834HAH1_RHOSS|nr:hypothetical protein RHSIM_Rhsim03G0232500 [Rhododendron simsii]